MATTTGEVLLQRLGEKVGDYYLLTTSSAGNAGGTTIVDTSLPNLPGGDDDDAFGNLYAGIKSGTNDGEVRRTTRTGYAQSTGTLTVAEAYTGQVASGVTFELHRFDPVEMRTCIGRAIGNLADVLYLPTLDETLFVDDQLSNTDFETWSGGSPSSWTLSGAGASETQETSRVYHGSNSLKQDSAAAVCRNSQNVYTAVNVSKLANKSVRFKMWVFATAANVARIGITLDGSTYSYSSYHTGNGDWELLSATVTFSTSATELSAVCEVATGTKTGYFDGGRGAGFFVGPVYRYTIPTAMVRGPHFVEFQASDDGPWLPLGFEAVPGEGDIMRLTGKGLLTVPTTDAATVELGENEVRLVVAEAARELYHINSAPQRAGGSQRAEFQQRAVEYAEEVRDLKASSGIKQRRSGAREYNGFHVGEDSSGRYLEFDRHR